MGARAGYDGTAISPMTYRHQRVVKLMDRLGSVRKVATLTGATYATIEKHYAQADPRIWDDAELMVEDGA